MRVFGVSVFRCASVAIAAALSVACGGGGGGGGAPAGGGNSAPTTDVTLTGAVTFDLVPSVAGGGLDYASTQIAPARGVTVELVSSANQVLAAGETDAAGQYSFTVARNTDVFVRTKAELTRTGSPSWAFRVVDNTNGQALYSLDGAVFNTGAADLTENLHAASGWDASTTSYASTRAAAPFAILDLVYDAAELVQSADPSVAFPALDINWSPDNVPNVGADGNPDLSSGEIGGTFFSSRFGIYLLGAEDADTEEYDRHVIAHEWGHYFEEAFSRADNIGGPHSLRDQLDLRVAFGEGFGNALSAMITGDTLYRDTSGPSQSVAGGFDVESAPFFNPNPNKGWYSEESVQEIIFDLFDSNMDTVEDNLSLGFAPLYNVLVNQQVAAIGLTSIFTFIDALKAAQPADAAAIDAIVRTQNIDAIADPYGSTETNSGTPSSNDTLPIYYDIAVNGGPVSNVCSTNEFSSANTGAENKLGSRQFLKFTVTAPGTHFISAKATLIPPGESADPDMVLHQAGSIAVSENAPAPNCTTLPASQCEESFSMTLGAGDYVLEVYEWTNTEPEDSTTPPIGRTCFDVEITQ